MVRTPEGASGNECRLPLQEPHDAVNLGGLDGLLEGHPGENGGDTAGQHGLPRAGRADHQKIMAAGRRHLQGTFGVLLPLDLGKVVAAFEMLPEEFVNIYPERGNLQLGVEKTHHLGQFIDADDVDSLHHRRFPGVF